MHSHNQTSYCCFQYKSFQYPAQLYRTLANDSHISAMVTVTLPHTTNAALCHIRFSPSTIDVAEHWSTPLSKVRTTNRNCPYKHKTSWYLQACTKDLLCMKELKLQWFQLQFASIKHIPNDFMPSCLHTTVASSLPHPLCMSHTVLQNPLKQISTLPSLSLCPPTRRKSPELHSG